MKADLITVHCPHCGMLYHLPDENLAEFYYCSKCLERFIVESNGSVKKYFRMQKFVRKKNKKKS